MTSKTNYCVYVYLRKKDYTPYYVGKGRPSRPTAKAHNVIVPRDPDRIVIVAKNLTNLGACAIERRLIRWYGRKDINTGILRNLTDGGDGGTSGYRHTQKTKDTISKVHKGKIVKSEVVNRIADKLRGKPLRHSASFSAGHSPWNNGKKMDENYKNRCSKAQTARFKNPIERERMKEVSGAGLMIMKKNCLKLIERDQVGKIRVYKSVGEYCLDTGHKQRNIYHHATKNYGAVISSGKLKDHTFWLISPDKLPELIKNILRNTIAA